MPLPSARAYAWAIWKRFQRSACWILSSPSDLDVRPLPEVVEPRALVGQELLEALGRRTVERATAAVEQLARRHAAGRVVRDELGQPDRLAGLGVDPVDHLGEVLGDVDLGRVDVLGAEVVVGRDTERHAAVGAPVAELDPPALLVAVVQHRLEHAADHPLGLARVDALAHRLVGHVVLVLTVLAVEDLRGDRDRRGVVEHRDLERHHREVALGERHHAGGAQVHALAGRRPPQHVAGVHAGAEVEDPLVLEQVGHRQQQWLVVDVEPDDLGVGCVDDRLPDPREPVGLLGVPDRPRLVEAVEERAVRVGLTALLDVAAHAEVAVADREDASRWCRGRRR